MPAIRISVFLGLIFLLAMGGIFLAARAAEPGSLPALAVSNEQPQAKEKLPSGKGSFIKRGRVRIATIGAESFKIDPDMAPQKIVEKAIEHWRNEFSQVLADKPDLIVVPEVCDRPANYPREKGQEYYRVRKNQVLDFFIEIAKKNRCYIVYPAVREMDDGTWRNSCALINRDGQIEGYYNKNHVVIEETTEDGILCGSDAPIFDCDFGRVAIAICFDLNFEELRLKYAEAQPDLIIFPSMYHGGLMQPYWAYSCRSYFVAAVAGETSEIRNPLGQVIASNTNYFDYAVAEINLDFRLAHLDYNWPRLQALKEKYGPGVTITDPGFVGAVLITSEIGDVPVDEMIAEFRIELLDDYFTRALAHRHKAGNME